MAKRLYIAIGSLTLLFIASVWLITAPREPVYEGRPISSWLRGHVASSAAQPPYGSPGWKEADVVLRKTGTNALPTMLKMIRAKELPRPAIKAWDWAANHHLLHRYYYASRQNEEARYAFEVLGTNAASAAPALIKLYQQNISAESKRCVASALGSIGSAAQSALPILMADFKSTNKQERFDAVTAVMSIHGDPNLFIPALESAVKDPDVDVRWNAVVGLSMYGFRARDAVPMLLEGLNDTAKVGTEPIKAQYETALWHIAPEKIGFPLVIAENPALTNGAFTLGPIQFDHNGRRETVLPAGKPIPCVRQFWDSEPRGTFSVYQMAGQSANDGTTLGEFEVTGLAPPPTNLNVSLLCVIAEGKTFLCARDNHSDQFLEIRKIK